MLIFLRMDSEIKVGNASTEGTGRRLIINIWQQYRNSEM